MGPAEWIAFASVALVIGGLVARGVWLMSKLHTTVVLILLPKVEGTYNTVVAHSEQCDPHRQELEFRVTAVETKLAEE